LSIKNWLHLESSNATLKLIVIGGHILVPKGTIDAGEFLNLGVGGTGPRGVWEGELGEVPSFL